MEAEIAARRKIERAAALKVQIQLEQEAKAKALQKTIHAQLQHTVQTRAAASVIQSGFRNFRMRQLWGGMAFAVHQRRIMAIRIQRFIRRHRRRVFFKVKLMQHQRALKERHVMMAVRIQRVYRRYRMLCLIHAAIKFNKPTVDFPKAVKQQSKPTRTKYRSKVHELAAARIQRAYRHYKFRTRFRALLDTQEKLTHQTHTSKKNSSSQKAHAHERRRLSQDEAAVRIQRVMKSKKKKKGQMKNLCRPSLLSPAKVSPLTMKSPQPYPHQPDAVGDDAIRMMQLKVFQQAQSVVFATEVTQVAQLATLIANSVNLEV
jgi:hypothetical protein